MGQNQGDQKPEKDLGKPKVGFQFNKDVDARGAQFIQAETVTTSQTTHFGVEPEQLTQLYAPILQAVQKAELSPAQQTQAKQAATELKDEIAKGKDASGEHLNKLVTDLLGLIPGALGALTGLFVNPLLTPVVSKLSATVLKSLKISG
jgi:hypothetical protein